MTAVTETTVCETLFGSFKWSTRGALEGWLPLGRGHIENMAMFTGLRLLPSGNKRRLVRPERGILLILWAFFRPVTDFLEVSTNILVEGKGYGICWRRTCLS